MVQFEVVTKILQHWTVWYQYGI